MSRGIWRFEGGKILPLRGLLQYFKEYEWKHSYKVRLERVSLFYSVNPIEHWRICELMICRSDIVISMMIIV